MTPHRFCPPITRLSGRQVTEISDRFLWDMRRFVADRIACEYVAGLREKSHQYGLKPGSRTTVTEASRPNFYNMADNPMKFPENFGTPATLPKTRSRILRPHIQQTTRMGRSLYQRRPQRQCLSTASGHVEETGRPGFHRRHQLYAIARVHPAVRR